MIPLTFHHSWSKLEERERQTAMCEFAANGVRHLVLGDTLLKMMGGDYHKFLGNESFFAPLVYITEIWKTVHLSN